MQETRHSDARDPMRAAVARLRSAAERAGLTVPAAPASSPATTLAAIREAIHPLQLPVAVEELWQEVDPGTLPLRVYPELMTPEAALSGWSMFREAPPQRVPRMLFPIASECHGFLLVELHDTRRLGGSVFRWSNSGEPFTLHHRCVTDFLLQMASRVERRAFDPGTLGRRRPDVFDPSWVNEARAMLASASPHPLHGLSATYDDDSTLWPAHWLVPPDRTAATGAARRSDRTTLGALLATAERGSWDPHGTVHVRVDAVTRIGGLWYADLVDCTSQVVGVVESGTTMLGPRAGDRYEVDLVVLPTSEGMLATVTDMRPIDD